MIYLLDSNVFITAKQNHYRLKTFPSFWALLKKQGTSTHKVLSIAAVMRELEPRKDELCTWAKACPKSMFVSELDQPTIATAATIATWTNAQKNYTAGAKAKFLSIADYWLVSHAKAHSMTLVTHELPSPESKARVLIPDVCNAHGVTYCTPWQMLEDLSVTF